MNQRARVKAPNSIEIVVTRADGTVDNYGEVMNSEWGFFRRWLASRRIKKLNRQHEQRSN